MSALFIGSSPISPKVSLETTARVSERQRLLEPLTSIGVGGLAHIHPVLRQRRASRPPSFTHQSTNDHKKRPAPINSEQAFTHANYSWLVPWDCTGFGASAVDNSRARRTNPTNSERCPPGSADETELVPPESSRLLRLRQRLNCT